MSRSYRHTMVYGHGGHSEKQDKRLYNRALRSLCRQTLNTCDDYDAVLLPRVCDVSNPWSMAKDGKSFCTWLDGYRRTLETVSYVRDGRTRRQRKLTASTIEHHKDEQFRRWQSWGHRYFSLEEYVGRISDINTAMDLIRK